MLLLLLRDVVTVGVMEAQSIYQHATVETAHDLLANILIHVRFDIVYNTCDDSQQKPTTAWVLFALRLPDQRTFTYH